jgi:hypothetical protein
MSKVSYITNEGLKKLISEVEYLKSVERLKFHRQLPMRAIKAIYRKMLI